MSDQANHDALPLIEALLDGTIDDAGFARLEAILLSDIAARSLYCSLMNLHATLPGIVGNAPRLSVRVTDAQDETLLEPHEMPHDQLMSLLVQVEADGEDLDPMALAAKRFPAKAYEKPSKHDWAMAGRYVLDHYITPKRVAYAAAAVVLLVASLLVFFLAGGPEPPEAAPVAIDPPQTRPTPALQTVQIVASITDQLNARWRYGDLPVELPVGTTLSPQQRLTLTHGFAQITTHRGAKVLIQAPSTIELTGSDNAIRLHRGKLVGRCDTADSKGFVVHMPGMDVVDLGTEFGVQADALGGSTVLVMEGEVRAQPTPESPRAFEPVVLTTAQARRVAPETGGLEMIARSETPTFYVQTPHPYVVAVLDAAPVAYWRFEDDGARTVTNEIKPGRNDLDMVGPATLISDGIIGKAGRLENRAEPYGYFETSSPIDRLSGFETGTIEFWYYADVRLKQKEGYDAAMLLSLHDTRQILDAPGTTSKEMIALELTDDAWLFDQERTKPLGWLEHSMRVYPSHFIDGEKQRDIYTDHAHPVQRWQHVVLVKEADKITLYFDGKRVEEMPHAFGPINPVSIRLGHTYPFDVLNREADPGLVPPTRPMLGRLDEVALYDKPLTAEQVARHHELAVGDAEAP